MSNLPPNRLNIAVAIIKVVLRTRKLRRNLMFILTVSMMIFVFLGAYPLSGFLADHPWLFVFFWGFSFLLVITVMLLAIYDMLRISKEESVDLDEIRRKLKSQQENEDE